MRYHVSGVGEDRWIERTPTGVRIEGREVPAEIQRIGPDEVSVRFEGATYRAFARRTPSGWRVQVRGRTFDLQVEDERAHAIRELAGVAAASVGPEDLRAPMPGLVVRVLVEPGQRIESGDALVVIEAMKMENELRADVPGVVSTVHAVPGAAVDRGDVLIAFGRES